MIPISNLRGRRIVRASLAAALWAGAVLASAAVNAAETGCDAHWQLQARHEQHSDALALRDFGDGASAKLAPRSGRNLAYVDDEVRASRGSCIGTWSVLARQSATLVTSRGALALALDAASAGRPAHSERWDVRGRYLAFVGAGIEWQGLWAPRPGWTLGFGAQGLALRHLRERQIDGMAGFDAASQAYDFDLASFEASDRLAFPFQTGFSARGWGLLFSGQIAWQGEQFGARLALHDAGWLRWSGLPQQDARLASATQAFDSDGFVIYQPLIQGSNSQPGRTRSPPLRMTVAMDWRFDARSRMELRLDSLQGYGVLPAVSASRDFGDLRLGMAWRSHERRTTLGLSWRGWRIDIGADRLGRGARSEEFGLTYRWPH